MAERHCEDLDLNMSGDSERLVISFTPFTPLNDGDGDNQPSDDITDDVTSTHSHQPTAFTVEVYQASSDVDDDEHTSTNQHTQHVNAPTVQRASGNADITVTDKITCEMPVSSATDFHQHKPSPSFLVENILPSSTDKESSRPLPGFNTIMTRPGEWTSRDPFQSHQIPLSFWDTPDYKYVLDSDYSSDNSQLPRPALSWTSCDIRSGHLDQQFPFIQPIHDTTPSPDDDKQRSGSSTARQNDVLASDSTTTNTHAAQSAPKPKAVQKAIMTRQNPLVEKKAYKRHPKPPYSYAAMSIMAIENSPNKALQYREITEAIREMFPAYFSGEYQGWRKSVRHMLSRMDCFDYEKNFNEFTNRSCYYWKVDLSKVNPEWFMRQSSKEDLRKTEHEYMPYLHQQLNVPPVILPERHCVNDTASTHSNASRAIRNIFMQHQHVDAMKKKVPEFSTSPLPKTEVKTSSSDFGVTLPTKPSNYKLNSMSTLAVDPDDFLGAKTNTIKPSVPTAEHLSETSVAPDVSPLVEDPVKDLGLPTYIFDSSIASPIPHDVYRDTEGPDRYCPSAESTSSTARPSETRSTSASSSATAVKPPTKKRTQTSTGENPKKKAKTSTEKKQPGRSMTFSDSFGEMSSAYQHVPSDQTTMSTPVFYPSTDPYQHCSSVMSAATPYLPPFSFETDKPLCCPPVDNVNIPFPPGGALPSIQFGYPPEQFPWYHQTGYPYQVPVSYSYPWYDSQYGVSSGYGYQQFQNEASRWYRVPYDGPLNLSMKSDY